MDLVDVTANPYADAEKVNTNFATVAAAIEAIPAPSEPESSVPEIVDARKFGVKTDGTNCTDAFLAAYEEACLSQGTLLMPAGTVIISGVDLGGAMYRSCTIEGLGFDGRGNGFGPASRIKLADGANRSLFKLLAGDCPHQRFRKLILEGNDANQTVSEFLVRAEDDSSPTVYPVGVHMEFVHMIRGKGGGLYLGWRRGSSYLSNVNTYMCGSGNTGHGIHINTYDVTMNNCHLGNSYGYGLYVSQTSQLECHSVHSYVNQMGGMYLGAGVTDMSFISGSIDRNIRYGVNSVKNTNVTYSGGKSFMGTRFHANSTVSDGGFPDVMISEGDTDFMFSGCSFLGAEDLTHRPAVAIQFKDTAGWARMSACKFAPATRWKYGAILAPTQIITDSRIY